MAWADQHARRVYQAAYYSARPEYVRAANQQHYSRKRAFIDGFKDVPCADCGGRFPSYVMDFDHRPDEIKLFEIAVGWGRSKLVLLAEIAKCDVVCSNCHRIRTAERRGLKAA